MATILFSFRRSGILLLGSLFMVHMARAQSATAINTYPDSSEGLQAQIQTVLAAIDTKDAKEEADTLESFAGGTALALSAAVGWRAGGTALALSAAVGWRTLWGLVYQRVRV